MKKGMTMEPELEIGVPQLKYDQKVKTQKKF